MPTKTKARANLTQYWKKRDFSKTSEPRGEVGDHTAHAFTVQKHDASVLHYDFRLELGGVLKSWAVPKGPSLDPSEKRLAIHVEDHPLSYGAFEGTIPQGEYGGGTVVLWDHGTWESMGDAEAGYAQGKLKFRLQGDKLQGGWTLVRIKGRETTGKKAPKTWLLIKERDEEARSHAEYDVTARRPESVASGREFPSKKPVKKAKAPSLSLQRKATFKRKKPAKLTPADLAGARAAEMPREVQPELATLVKAPPVGDEWLNEVKFDGYRMIGRVEDGDASLITRGGKDWTTRFPALAAALLALPVEELVVDGEVVAIDAKGNVSFQALQNSLEKRADGEGVPGLGYFLFDVLHFDGHDLRQMPLVKRKAVLENLLAKAGKSPLLFSQHVVGKGPETFQSLSRSGVEGMMAKRASSVYRERRTTDWLKVKCVNSEEFVIGGYVPSESFKGQLGALLLGYFDEKHRLKYCGKVGTGFNEKTRASLTARLDRISEVKAPFLDPPGGSGFKNPVWTRPLLLAQVEFTEWTGEGLLRHPSFQGLRQDKMPKDVVKELAVDVMLTRPDKVLFPDVGFTKADLAKYFEAVAPRLLPFIVGRPLSLLRCPQGSAGKCFFQRHHSGAAPQGLGSVEVGDNGDESSYITVKDQSALRTLAQLGALELHPWGARNAALESPDVVTFDLDPGEGISWADLVLAAQTIRTMLKKLGLQSFVKTTGGKGLHVVVPLAGKANWEEVTAFTKALAEGLARFDPKRYVAKMGKGARKGKIFVDYHRNKRSATSVSAYSPRARDGAYVSMPLSWDELAKAKKMPRFDLKTALKRLETADPWAKYFTVKQDLKGVMTAALLGMS